MKCLFVLAAVVAAGHALVELPSWARGGRAHLLRGVNNVAGVEQKSFPAFLVSLLIASAGCRAEKRRIFLLAGLL